MGPGMLYKVGQVFLQGVRFAILYNELTHENMTNLLKGVFFTWFIKYINAVETESEVSETVVWHPTQIYQVPPFKSDYWVEHCTIDMYICCGQLITQVLPAG